ncbi:hypothetical protein KVR01_008974 [Diaporthe batatas]|uniref:uncharacterized protein n=1 Tax=Diaporthe batatas TaxID=748121 RepID=UPI001D048BE4|nr:uncharacterized protein KVR01_008974 [Diaporthe batatas]KAG8160710.1 hypothetical protein KVR01_008974 [Diaporthe batatas]
MAPFVTDSERIQLPSSSPFEDGTPIHTPFSRAIDDFLKELNAEDDSRNPFLAELRATRRELANNPGCKAETQAAAAKLRGFMDDLQTQKSSGRGPRLLARLDPFIDSLSRVMGLCESVLNAAPFGVSVAFSGARVVLKLAMQMHSCLESIVDAMVQIGISLKCYEKFAKAFPNTEEVQDLLVSSYKNIVTFWYKACRVLSRHSLKTVIRSTTRSMDREIKTALEGLDRDRSNVIALAQATTAEQAIHTKEATLKQGVIDWIKSGSHVDITPIIDEQLALRAEGTCNWLFEDKRFQKWFDVMDNTALWYNAKPGSGKTVYAATIVDHLRTRDKKVAYFFYSFNSPQRKFAISGLRSLALQLLNKFVPDIPDKVVQRYKDEFDSSADGLESIHSVSHVVHDLLTQCPETFVVVDGIDECLDDDVLLATLQHLLKMPTYGLVKWLFTSRNSPKIRSVMEDCQAIEVEAPTASVSNDIHTYFSKYITCQSCIEEWTEDEDNFLYSKLICDTLRGEGLTTDAEIEEALNRYPKNLNGYYMRVLEKLCMKTEQQQELARRAFLILIAAAQSISLDEMRNALAVVPGAEDHDPRRVPYTKNIENLCSPLITFGKPRGGDAEDNPLLKLCHKTVEDFFLQNPDTLSLDPKSGLWKYFVNHQEANEAMAMDCVTYLQYKRYQSPTPKIGAILSKPIPKEHAFLPYAATFWAQHCDGIGQHPAEKIVHAVLKFLQSPTLPSCLEVQAHVGPYLFGRYVDRRNGLAFRMCVKGSRLRGSDSFGVPLPQWLDKVSSHGWTLDRSLCHFISEWREVLIQHPDSLDSCLPLTKLENSCHLDRLKGHKHVTVAYLEDQCKHLSPSGKLDAKDFQILRVAFHGTTLWVDVISHQVNGIYQRLQIPLFSKKKSIIQSSHSARLPDGDLLGWTMSVTGEKGKHIIEAWKADALDLSIRRILDDKSKQHRVPLAFSSTGDGKRKGSWEVQSTQSFESDGESNGLMQVVHFTWKSKKHVADSNMTGLFEQDRDSDSSSGESEEEEDSPSPASPESMSDDDSDDDSDDESTTTRSRTTETADEASYTDSESDTDSGQITDCLVLMPSEDDPSWYPWSGTRQIWARIGCAAHPTLPLLAVSHTARQLEVIDTVAGTRKTKHLPDLADLQDAPLASLRELRFSPCGNYLHFLSIAFVPRRETASTEARVTLTTFSFNHEGTTDDTLFRECPPQECTYSFGETLADVPLPLALTHWSDTEVIVALPPLTCDPKILKLMLSALPDLPVPGPDDDRCAGGNNILTLQSAIYFPTSTPIRQARLMYRNEGQSDVKAEGRLYLVLDRLVPSDGSKHADGVESGEKTTDSSTSKNDEGGDTGAPELGQASPPVVLRWKIAHNDGWRAWDPEADSKASDLKREVPVWKMLRGQFVDSDKLFSVPIRSGLDWTRKGYLSCGVIG